MFESIDWRQIILTIALIAASIALVWSRLSPDKRHAFMAQLRPGHAHGAAGAHPAAPTPTPHHDAHAHDDDGHGHAKANKPRPILSAIIVLAAIGIMLAGFFFFEESPSVGSVGETIRERWLVFGLALVLLNLGASFGDDRWGLKSIATITTVAIICIALLSFCSGSNASGSQQASARRMAQPTREPNPEGQWSMFTAPADGTIHWILTPKGHRVNICDPGINPNCDSTDPSTWRYQRYCRVNGEVFARETGKCVMTEAVGVRSKTGAPLTLASLDVPLGTQAALEQPAAEPEPSTEPAAETEQSAPATEPEPAAAQPEEPVRKTTVEPVYGTPMDSYRQDN